MPSARPYHHGDLRQALLDASLALLRDEGLDALTLRAVARAAGVSQTAPYRHFADRTALLAAVAEDGFRRLHVRMLRAATAPHGGRTERAGLQQIALAYLRFALEHPAEYRLMFGDELAAERGSAVSASFDEARSSVFGLLSHGIAMLQKKKMVRRGNLAEITLTAWALVHGVVMLTLDGHVKPGTPAAAEKLTKTATSLLMFGMTATGL